MLKKILVVASLLAGILLSCGQGGDDKVITPAVIKVSNSVASTGLKLLSEYNFFKGNIADLSPVDGVVPYDLNTPLFSDYAYKARFIQLPAGEAANYVENETFDFPVGTKIIKNFYYPNDFTDASKGRRIIETRILMHEASGWVGLPYIWNDEQTDAALEITGGRIDISWIYNDGKERKLNYVVPNMNQCKGCHVQKDKMVPIGPKARHLNGTFEYTDGAANQIEKWVSLGMLQGVPPMAEVPKLPKWIDTNESLNDRARAYLDINCGHCHSQDGPANTSGLLLEYHQQNLSALGFYKSPIAAGRGSGGFKHDIEPGNPDESILLFRMASLDPGVMMPELGRKLAHPEGLELIRAWIASMNPDDYK